MGCRCGVAVVDKPVQGCHYISHSAVGLHQGLTVESPMTDRITGMKCVRRVAFTLLVSVMATTAHAGAPKLSLFNCGVQFGGNTKIQKAYPAPKKDRGYGADQTVKSIESKKTGVATFIGARSNEIGRRRLPPAFTVARVGCSWR